MKPLGKASAQSSRMLPKRVKRIADWVPPPMGRRRKEAERKELRHIFYELRPKMTDRSDFDVCVSVADRYARTHPPDGPDGWPEYTRAEDGGLRGEDARNAARRVWKMIQ